MQIAPIVQTQRDASGPDFIIPGDPIGPAGVLSNIVGYDETGNQAPSRVPRASWWQRLLHKRQHKLSTPEGRFIGKTPYAVVYERRPVPTVNNALAYAFDSLALPATAPVGSATAVRLRPFVATRPGQFQGSQVPWSQQALVSGLPIVAGQMFGQQLLNPAVPGGYINEPAGNLMPTRNAVL